MKTLAVLFTLILVLTACDQTSNSNIAIDETSQEIQEIKDKEPVETAVPSTPQPIQPTIVSPTPVQETVTPNNQVPTNTITSPTTTSVSKTQEILNVIYEKITKGVSYTNKGDTIYMKGPINAVKMTIVFGQMYTIPGSQRTDYSFADQIDVAYFDLATGKGRGYCLGRIGGSEFSCNDLQDKGFDLKYTNFADRNALYYLEQHKDVDPDVYQKKAERVEGVSTSRIEYGQGKDQIIIWISDFNKMPVKVAQRIKDPYTQETHYQDWNFGISDDVMKDPFV